MTNPDSSPVEGADVERVARALVPVLHGSREDEFGYDLPDMQFDDLSPEWQERHRDYARAAIAALQRSALTPERLVSNLALSDDAKQEIDRLLRTPGIVQPILVGADQANKCPACGGAAFSVGGVCSLQCHGAAKADQPTLPAPMEATNLQKVQISPAPVDRFADAGKVIAPVDEVIARVQRRIDGIVGGHGFVTISVGDARTLLARANQAGEAA